MNLKKNGKVFMSKFVGTGPTSYEKRIYWAAVSQRLRNSALENILGNVEDSICFTKCPNLRTGKIHTQKS
jgi:hypothetical protein